MKRQDLERKKDSTGAADNGHWQKTPKPSWIRVRLPSGEAFQRLKDLMRSKSLHTVCEEARCPNMAECWGCGTATFLILGDICTRDCRFCAVKTGNPGLNFLNLKEEPGQVADAVAAMELRHAVITSVTRDDLEDGGASIFAETIRKIHERTPGCTVEVLIPDFKGNLDSLKAVVKARPDILGHNVETVPRLYPLARPQAAYGRSLRVLEAVKEIDLNILTKSGVMVGLGETREEILDVLKDLRSVGCDIFTIGQYLSPTQHHLPVVRYYTPEEFESLKEAGIRAGFRWVESGPLVRSSYHAEAQVRELQTRRVGITHGPVQS